MSEVNYLILKDSIVLNYEGKTFTAEKNTDIYMEVLQHIKSGDLSSLPSIIDNGQRVKSYVVGKEFEVIDGRVYSHGAPVIDYISDKLLEFSKKNIPYKFLLNFWNRLKANPSSNSVSQLYRFLEKAKCPITPDGYFIAYKAVTADFKDKHSRTVDYKIGVATTQDRDTISDNPSCSCGTGLHVGSYKYANNFSNGKDDIILEVKVDPADVVSVPDDSSSGKCRCCRVLPIGTNKNGEIKKSAVHKPTAKQNLDPSVKASKVTFIIKKKQYEEFVILESEMNEYKSSNITRLRPSKLPKNLKAEFAQGNRSPIKEAYRYDTVISPYYFIIDSEGIIYKYMPIITVA